METEERMKKTKIDVMKKQNQYLDRKYEKEKIQTMMTK
jgi:hypothetical protein